MCYAVFIATPEPQQVGEFIPEVTKLFLQKPSDDELEGMRDKFTLPHIYYVGSDTKCSCGFDFHSESWDDNNSQDSKASPQALLDLLNKLTNKERIEYYCWFGDWAEPVENVRTLNSSEIKLAENYFELVEREFIIFERQ